MPRLIETLKKKALDGAVANGHNMSKFQRVQGGAEVHVASCKDCGADVEINIERDETPITGSAFLQTCGEYLAESRFEDAVMFPEPCDGGLGTSHINPECVMPLTMEEAMEAIEMKTEPIKPGDGTMSGRMESNAPKELSTTTLSKEDQIAFAELLIDPPQPNDAMKRAFKRRPTSADFDLPYPPGPDDCAPRAKKAKFVFHYMRHRKFPKILAPINAPKSTKEGTPVLKERPSYGTMPDGTTYNMRHSGWLRTTSRKCEDKEYDFHNNSVRRRLA